MRGEWGGVEVSGSECGQVGACVGEWEHMWVSRSMYGWVGTFMGKWEVCTYSESDPCKTVHGKVEDSTFKISVIYDMPFLFSWLNFFLYDATSPIH